MKLVIRTQYMENYGAHDWDGTGTCPQHWKMKGGSEYMVTGVNSNQDFETIVEIANVEFSDIGAREYIVGWSVEPDSYMSDFEKSQLEYDGAICYAEPRVSWADIENQVLHSDRIEIEWNRKVEETA